MNFSNANLVAAAASLAPFTLRFGGTGNDYLHYSCETGKPTVDSDTYGCLNATHRRELLGLAHKAGGKFLFGVSFDMASACSSTPSTSYVWNPSEWEELISTMRTAKDPPIWGFELGNEVNNREMGGNGHCGDEGLLPSQQAAAINALADAMEKLWPEAATRPMLVGPDTGYYNASSWLNATLSGISRKLHAVTHHVYPGISRKNFNSPSALDRVLNDIEWYIPIVNTLANGAKHGQEKMDQLVAVSLERAPVRLAILIMCQCADFMGAFCGMPTIWHCVLTGGISSTRGRILLGGGIL